MKKERMWMRVNSGEAFKCTGCAGCTEHATAILCDAQGNAYAGACCHSHLWGDLRHWKVPFAVVAMKDRVTFFASDELEYFAPCAQTERAHHANRRL